MAAAPTNRWTRLSWVHRWDDAGELVPRGNYSEGFDELLVELVEPRLRGGGMLVISFRQGRWAGTVDVAPIWVPIRITVLNEGTTEKGLRLSLSRETMRSLREMPLTFLLERAQEYVSSVPFPGTDHSADSPLSALRNGLAQSGLRRADRRDLLRRHFPEALSLAISTHPRNPTAWLARELGVGTATIRRWTADERALNDERRKGEG